MASSDSGEVKSLSSSFVTLVSVFCRTGRAEQAGVVGGLIEAAHRSATAADGGLPRFFGPAVADTGVVVLLPDGADFTAALTGMSGGENFVTFFFTYQTQINREWMSMKKRWERCPLAVSDWLRKDAFPKVSVTYSNRWNVQVIPLRRWNNNRGLGWWRSRWRRLDLGSGQGRSSRCQYVCFVGGRGLPSGRFDLQTDTLPILVDGHA